MHKDILDHLNKVSDQVIEEYFKNHLIIFTDNNERKKELFKSITLKQKRWSKKQTCIVNGCNNISIKRSHTIQKSGPILSVSKNSIVMTPEFDLNNRVLTLKEKGLNEASTFPGYCKSHEGLFSSFEETKDLFSGDAIALQLYRTVCRELFRIKVEIEAHENQKKEYITFRNRKFVSMMIERLTPKWMVENDIKVDELSISEDSCLIEIEKTISELYATYKEIEENHLYELENTIKGNDIKKEETMLIKVQANLPLTLSGFGSFYVTKEKRVLIFCGVYPNSEKNENIIVLYCKDDDTKYLKEYLKLFSQNGEIATLNIIEQFMIRGTDHWFINPDVWNSFSKEKQNKILNELLDRTKGINFPINFTIFDNV